MLVSNGFLSRKRAGGYSFVSELASTDSSRVAFMTGGNVVRGEDLLSSERCSDNLFKNL
jgi:hypothetical protein